MQDWHLDKVERFLDVELLERVEQRSVLEVWEVRLPDGRKARLVLFSPKATQQLSPFPGDRSAVARPHPRILDLLGVGTERTSGGNCAYLLLEWVEARRLSDLMSQGPLWTRREAQDRAVSLAWNLAGIVSNLEADEANRAGWVPGHLNPDTVWLASNGEVFLEHPLLAQALSELQSLSFRSASKYLGYMSPEQVRGRALDMRSDLFSLGVVVYELLSGKKLFEGASRSEIVAKVKEASVPPLAEVCPWVEERIATVISQALARDVDARPKSWAVWLAELEAVAGVGISGTRGTPGTPAAAKETEAWAGPGPRAPASRAGISEADGADARHGQSGADGDAEGRGRTEVVASQNREPRGVWQPGLTVDAAVHPDMVTRATGAVHVQVEGGQQGRVPAWWHHWAWEVGLSALLLVVGVTFVSVRQSGKSSHRDAVSASIGRTAAERPVGWKLLSRRHVSDGKDLVLVGGGSGKSRPSLRVGNLCLHPQYWIRSAEGKWSAVFLVSSDAGNVQPGDCDR